MVDSIPEYHLDMIANGLVSTSLPTLGPIPVDDIRLFECCHLCKRYPVSTSYSLILVA